MFGILEIALISLAVCVAYDLFWRTWLAPWVMSWFKKKEE